MCVCVCVCVCVAESCSVVSDSLRPHGLKSPWNVLGQNTTVGSFSLLQGIFPTQGSNPGLTHCRWILYQLSHKENLRYQGNTRETKGAFQAKMDSVKNRNCMGLTEAEILRRGGQNTQKNCTKKIFTTQITMMVWSLTQSQTSWNAKSPGPYETSLWTKLVEMIKFQLCAFKS